MLLDHLAGSDPVPHTQPTEITAKVRPMGRKNSRE